MDDKNDLNGVNPEEKEETAAVHEESETAAEPAEQAASEETEAQQGSEGDNDAKLNDEDEVDLPAGDTFGGDYTEPALKNAVIITPDDEVSRSNAEAARKIGKADVYRAARAEKFCVNCGKNRKAAGSDYCDECRMEMLTTNAPFTAWLVAFASLTASLFALIVLILNAPVALLSVEAKYEARRNCQFNSYYNYVEAISRADETNEKMSGKVDYIVIGERFNCDMLSAAFRASPSVDTVLSLGNTYYSIISKYDDLALYKQLLDGYYSVVKIEAVQGVLSNVQYGAIDFDGAMEALNSVETENDTQRIILDAIKLSVCDALLEDSDDYYAAQLRIYQAAEKDLPSHEWFYNSGLMESYFYTKDYESMIKYCNKVIAADHNDNSAGYCKMVYLMSSGKKAEAESFSAEYSKYNPGVSNVAVACERRFGSLDEAIEMCSAVTGDQMAATEDKVECYRQQALAYIAKGEYGKAFDVSYLAINEAQSLSSITNNAYSNAIVYETLAVSAYLCYENSDESGEYSDYVTQVYSGSDEDLSSYPKNIQDILSGKTNVNDILLKGAGDLL